MASRCLANASDERECVMKILCATDLCPESESAIERAGRLAGRLGAELSILHVVPSAEPDRMLKESLLRASRELKARVRSSLWRYGPAPNVYVRVGNPTRSLIRTMKDLNPDLIVLGRHRRRPARDSVRGTLDARMLGECDCPVLIVDRMPLDSYRNIVLALDRTKVAAETVRVTEALVLNDGVRATIVHAYGPRYEGALTSAGIAADVASRYAEALKHEASSALRDLLRGVSKDSSRYGLVIENATPTVAIHKVVHRVKPDLLVLGTRATGRLGSALLGSVADRGITAARCDVVVVPDRTLSVASRRERRMWAAIESAICSSHGAPVRHAGHRQQIRDKHAESLGVVGH